jgi:hypothetical protein
MTERRRLQHAWLLPAIAAAGCLPDPPKYDACVNDESQYYTVSPKGCNGHELVTLWEQQTELSQKNDSGQFIKYGVRLLSSQVMLDRKAVYWTDMSGTVIRADKQSGTSRVLFESPSGNSGVVGLDSAGNRLYVEAIVIEDATQRVSSRVIGIDVGTGESRILADLADVVISGVTFVGSRFYFFIEGYGSTGGDGPTLFTGPIDWDSTSRIGDLRTCMSLPAGGSANSGLTLYWIDADGTSLVRADLESCTTSSVLRLQSELVNQPFVWEAEGQLYVDKCNSSGLECGLYRIASDGSLEFLARRLFDPNAPGNAGVDPADMYSVDRLDGDFAEPPRLYKKWLDSTSSPLALAAPFGGTNVLAVDAEYVYVWQNSFDTDGGVIEGSTGFIFERLVRVKR